MATRPPVMHPHSQYLLCLSHLCGSATKLSRTESVTQTTLGGPESLPTRCEGNPITPTLEDMLVLVPWRCRSPGAGLCWIL